MKKKHRARKQKKAIYNVMKWKGEWNKMWNWKLIESADASEFSSWDISLRFLPVQLVPDLPDIFIQSHAHLNLLVHPVSWKWETKYYILYVLYHESEKKLYSYVKTYTGLWSWFFITSSPKRKGEGVIILTDIKDKIMHIFISWFLFQNESICNMYPVKKW